MKTVQYENGEEDQNGKQYATICTDFCMRKNSPLKNMK
jgi:hypothetical protein